MSEDNTYVATSWYGKSRNWEREFGNELDAQNYVRTCPDSWQPHQWWELHQKWEMASPEKRSKDMRHLAETATKWFGIIRRS